METHTKFESLYSNREERAVWTHPSSPEFEFWMVRNPSVPQSNILSADELFVDGVLLPLDLVPNKETVSVQENEENGTIGPELTSPSPPCTAVGTTSRRWKDMFKAVSKESEEKVESSKMIKKRERKSGSGGHGGASASSAELNINIWPFSRSRSAGNGGAHNGSRTKISTTRKVSSAPCSRSNSGGESKSRKWPASPGRAGVPVGRSSPVWQMRRGPPTSVPRSSTPNEASESRKIGRAKILKSCKQGASASVVGGGLSRKGNGGSNDGSGVVNLFGLRNLFSKKVY